MSARTSLTAADQIEPLTRREREILILLGQGFTAPEIAEQLTLAVSSVKSHIQHIYGKLGVNSRREAITRVRELDLPPREPAPALPSAASARHNLPQQLTRLIGREHEIGALRKLLVGSQPPARLVTLVGPGGAGKTRLSLAVAAEALSAYRDGVWFVGVALLDNPELLAQTVAAGLGLRVLIDPASPSPEVARPLLEKLLEYVQTKDCLVVLDNCEHLVDACARLAETLLRASPRLQILATSREPLGVAGEAVWPVTGLDLPPADQAPEQAVACAAVQLFAERARQARPSFSVTAQNAVGLAQVCRQLDGLPLAIELAAARVSLLPVEQIAALLEANDRFRLLTGGGRTALPRHQTLLATIEWSYQLLSDAERALLRRLAVFAGGWTLAAAEAVCADASAPAAGPGALLPAGDVLEVLSRLVTKSLVVSEASRGVEARFRLLETIGEFAAGKLEQSGEAAALRQRHFAFFLALAEQAEPELGGPEQLAWLDRLEADHENLRRALDWAIERQSSDGLCLAAALHRFWLVRGYSTEALNWFNRLLASSPPQPTAAWAMGLARAAFFARCASTGVDATAHCQAGLALSRTLGAAGRRPAAYALLELGWIKLRDNAPETPLLQQESLALFVEAGDEWGQAMALLDMAVAAKIAGDNDRAQTALERCRGLFERLGDLSGQARTLYELAQVAGWRSDFRLACELHQAALVYYRRLRDWDGAAVVLFDLADALHTLGEYDRALAATDEGIALLRGVGHQSEIPYSLDRLAGNAYERGDYERALALVAEGRQVALNLGDPDEYVAGSEFSMASIAYAQGDPARAVTMIDNILPVLRAHGHVWWTAFSQKALGHALRDVGEYERPQL